MSQLPESRDVLLSAVDLYERRLIFGELLEAGYDILPLPGFAPALGALLQRTVAPRLVLLDVQGDEHATPQSVEHLASLVPGVPVVVIAGSIDRALWEPLADRVAALLYRPITIGRITERVKQIVPASESK
jgi:DNA-binding NtrC family response regulator